MNMTQEYIPVPLPIDQDIETKKVLKKIVSANKALAELKGAALTLQEAKAWKNLVHLTGISMLLMTVTINTEQILKTYK